MAGVMGGLDTEVRRARRNILLEAANFNLVSIRRTTQALRLPSEANLRFGKGIHPELAEPATRRACELMRLLAGGVIAQGMVDAYPLQPQPVVIDLTLAEVERNLGLRFELAQIASLLEPLEFGCQSVDDETLRVTVPNHRVDCAYPADLIEDLARIYGYDNLPVTEMADRLPPQRGNRALEREEQVRDLLVACGLQEVITYSLTHPAREAALEPGADPDALPAEEYITLANPINQDRLVMRRRLLTTVLETAAANLRFRDRVEIFELGRVFLPQPDQQLPDEIPQLVLIMIGPRDDRHWLASEGPDLDFYDLKGVVEALLGGLHIGGAAYEAAEHPTYQPGRTARLLVDGVEIGLLGEIHPQVRAAWDLPGRRVAAAELDLGALLARVPDAWFVEPLSAYPAVLQDLALIVDETVPAAQVQALIASAGGFLLKEVTPFDLYRGDPIPAGKKSLAFALVFQAPDKTLSDAMVNKQVKRIVLQLERELGAKLRS